MVNLINEYEAKNLKVSDLEDGTVFLDQDGTVMVKVSYLSGYEPKTYVLCLGLMELFDDIDAYVVTRIVDADIYVK